MSETALEIKKLGEDIQQTIQKANAQTLESANAEGKKVANEVKNELTNMLQKHQELTQKHMDELETAMKKAQGENKAKQPTFGDLLVKGIEENKDNVRSKRKFELEFDAKAVGDMGINLVTGNNLAAGILTPDRRPGILTAPALFTHVRDFMTVRPTNSRAVEYVRENGGEGSPATVREGELKPQIDYDLSLQSATITKIAAHLRLSEELIEDVPYITNYVTTRGAEDLRSVEDQQILYGDGVGTNIRGLNLDAVPFARPTGLTAITGATLPDIIRAAMAQLRVGRYAASAVLLNPMDIANLELSKDAQGGYLYVNTANQGAVSTIWRLPIVETDTVAVGSFFIGDFRNGAEILDRRALNVRFYEQDRDNAIRNMVTIVIEERVGLAVIRPAAFVRGTFAAARTALAAA